MSDNQYAHEIIRDVGYLVKGLSTHETVWLNVKNDGKGFFTARSSKGMPCGSSETSRAIEKAFNVSRGNPDPRDLRIKQLESLLNEAIVYLDTNELTSIGSGSILHNKFKDVRGSHL